MARKACAVCGYPLEHLGTDKDEEDLSTWFHVRDWIKSMPDHIAVPVNASEIQLNGRCDFCDSDDDVDWVVLAETFVLPDEISRSVGGWAACVACKPLVERKRWSQLITRIKQNGPESNRRTPRWQFEKLYAALEPHILGVISIEEFRARGAETDL